MNGNDNHDASDHVFINHGWERLRIAEHLDARKTYRAYNRMHHIEKTTYAGDTYVLDGDRIIAVYEGVIFKGVSRRALHHALPGKSKLETVKSSVSQSSRQPLNTSLKATSPSRIHSSEQLATRPDKKTVCSISSSPSSRILTMIADEVGMSLSDLRPEHDFAELGVDSLLSLTLVSKIREQLAFDISQTLFTDHPTVGDIERLFSVENTTSTTVSRTSSYTQAMSNSSIETPPTPISIHDAAAVPFKRENRISAEQHAILLLRKIIIEETGVDEESLQPSTSLADIGVDSLLGLNISSRMREGLGAQISGSIFLEYETMQEIENAICQAIDARTVNTQNIDVIDSNLERDTASHVSHRPRPQLRSVTTNYFNHQSKTRAMPDTKTVSTSRATSILLSGPPQNAEQIVFLFPDGSGSASSYVDFAQAVALSERAVYGLNCPWRKTAEEMTRSGIDFPTMVARYIPEIKNLIQQQSRSETNPDIQDAGSQVPSLILGGWSAGGILAFEAARQLRQGPDPTFVSHLLLLDSPNPIGLQNPPQRMYDFFDSLGIFGSKSTKSAKDGNKAPPWLRAHFDAFVRTLDDYKPAVLEDAPRSLILYARDGVCKDENGPTMETFPEDPREMLWLLNNRTDFSADGWASLLGRRNLSVGIVNGVNHFTLMDAGGSMQSMAQMVNAFLS